MNKIEVKMKQVKAARKRIFGADKKKKTDMSV